MIQRLAFDILQFLKQHLLLLLKRTYFFCQIAFFLSETLSLFADICHPILKQQQRFLNIVSAVIV